MAPFTGNPFKVRSLRKYLRKFIDSRGPRTRFVIFKAVIMAGRPFDVEILHRLAIELEREGPFRLALQCWELIHRVAPYGSDGLIDHLPVAVTSGEMAQVRWFTEQARREVGLPPGQTIGLAGMLACAGHHGEAGRVLGFLAHASSDGRRAVSQSPSVLLGSMPKDLTRLAQELERPRSGAEEGGVHPYLELARLCFTFRKMEVAAKLFRLAANHVDLTALDSVAMSYAGARAGMATDFATIDEEALAWLGKRMSTNPDALAMLAHVALVSGDGRSAARAMERAVRVKYAGLEQVEEIVGDCLAMLGIIDTLKERPSELPGELLEEPDGNRDDGVPKVFICGFGWSGSGAVYDEIRGSEGFSEFEGAGDAPLLNADSGTEATFIQADAGLGDFWIAARSTRRVAWQRLWDMLCLHVTGLSGIGYNSYKSCAAATNNVQRHAHAYTRPFREFFEGYAALLEAPMRAGLGDLLGRTTESLCRMLLEQKGGRAVLFNNAIFGREVEMLQIFKASRAVVVFRDPLDVYADRRLKDKNHWRSPRQLAELYGWGLQKYITYRQGRQERVLGNLREVPFERFVLDRVYREQVRDWLLSGTVDNVGRSHFDPVVSSGNIGIHRGMLDANGCNQMQAMTASYRRMQELAAMAWDAGE